MYIRHSTEGRSNAENPTKGASDVEYSTFDGRPNECRKSDIRRRVLWMSNIRHSTDCRWNVENPTSEEGRFECRIFNIRRGVFRMSNIRHSTMRPIESKKSDPTIRRIESNFRHSIRQNAHV